MQAVYVGRGWYEGAEVYMPGIWTDYLYYSKDGNLMTPTEDAHGKYVNPETLPAFDHKEPYHFSPGQLVYLPVWDKEKTLLEKIYLSQYFAKPEFENRIKKWYGEGLSGEEVWAKVRDAGGLLTPEDLGLKKSLAAQVEAVNEAGPVKEGG